MRLFLAALAAAGIASVQAQIDPAACATASTLKYNFDLSAAAGCYKGTVDHATGDTVEVSVNFPVATPSEAIDVPFDQDTVYAIYVFDSTQGSDNTADWAFGTAPAYGITGMLGTTTLGSVTLLARASSGFGSTTGTFLRTAELTNPSGEYTISFTADNTKTTKLKYVVAIKKLDSAMGHRALSSDHRLEFEFGKLGSQKYLSLSGWSGTSDTMYARAKNYGPGVDGRLVTDLEMSATFSSGIKANSFTTSSDYTGASSATRVSITSNVFKSEVDFPAAVLPRNPGGHGAAVTPGDLLVTWNFDLYDTSGTTDIGLDLTAAPGPFVGIQAGNPADTFMEAEALTPGATLTTVFDTEKRSTDDNRAKLSHKLISLDMPARWSSASFSMTGTPGDGPDSGKSSELGRWFDKIRFSGQTITPGNAGVPSNAFIDSVRYPGVLVMPNAAVGSVSSLDPLASVSSRQSLTNTPNWPLFDNRFITPRKAYILLCRQVSCLTTSSTTAPLKISAAVKWEKVEEIPGECSSNADCVSGDNGHPGQARASAFSANGDVNRLSNCIVAPDATGRRPETRCVECFSDCDCNPGQFCYSYTGLEQVSGVWYVADEMSRLRMGMCMKKDLNNTVLGKQCRRPTSYNYQSAYSTNSPTATFSASQTRVVQGQEGPIQCGEALYYNGSTEVSTSSSATNVSGQVLRWLWTGACDGDGICRECTSGVDGAVATACGTEQVCLDGTYWRGRSIDGTVRTMTNDTRAGLLLAMLLIALFCLLVALVACMCKSCCSCCSGRKSTVQSKEGGKDEATSSKTAAAATPAQP
ncbi:hypothetical protein FNF29_04889 [Cafeteria roenbergensis]|uniref:Uncharacterized protein n=1 Tax=Cafeteria roenbergensis TaxID=33653 RepID=A0A5A8CE78_CAFRO|nr:hypothetical protein FNF29_04889 [Cafeteria roenbergensis]|eukprot:KAA0150999.1 hypothetical protein FNF29_04889 [Cafeteria roenbergensis]